MRTYFEYLERIRKASTALRKEENTLPVDGNKVHNVKMILNALLDEYSKKWPEPADGVCSCSVEGSEGCRPKVCPNPECDTIIEGADFCSHECSAEYDDLTDLPDMRFEPSMHEASERLKKRLKGESDGNS